MRILIFHFHFRNTVREKKCRSSTPRSMYLNSLKVFCNIYQIFRYFFMPSCFSYFDTIICVDISKSHIHLIFQDYTRVLKLPNNWALSRWRVKTKLIFVSFLPLYFPIVYKRYNRTNCILGEYSIIKFFLIFLLRYEMIPCIYSPLLRISKRRWFR